MPRVYLHLTFQPDNFVQTSMKAAATAEAARIWSDYGVAIESDAQPAFCDAGTERLLIVLGGASDVGKGQDSLGAIHFAPDGTSDSIVILDYRAVSRLAMSVPVVGAPSSQWTDRVRDQAIGRALGRALAHEIGHFLLRWPHHSASGLMRAQHKASWLIGADRRPFQLTATERARLEVTTASGRPLDAAGACGALAAARAQP